MYVHAVYTFVKNIIETSYLAHARRGWCLSDTVFVRMSLRKESLYVLFVNVVAGLCVSLVS